MPDAVDVVDVSASEFVMSPPSGHLAFSGITYTPGIIVSQLIFLLHKEFLSFLIRQRREPTLRMSCCPIFPSLSSNRVDSLPYSFMSNFPLSKAPDD